MTASMSCENKVQCYTQFIQHCVTVPLSERLSLQAPVYQWIKDLEREEAQNSPELQRGLEAAEAAWQQACRERRTCKRCGGAFPILALVGMAIGGISGQLMPVLEGGLLGGVFGFGIDACNAKADTASDVLSQFEELFEKQIAWVEEKRYLASKQIVHLTRQIQAEPREEARLSGEIEQLVALRSYFQDVLADHRDIGCARTEPSGGGRFSAYHPPKLRVLKA